MPAHSRHSSAYQGLPLSRLSAAIVLGILQAACDHNDVTPYPSSRLEQEKNDTWDVVLTEDSPKRRYVVEGIAEPVKRPLMEPVTARINYDETRTVRIQSPIQGRITHISVRTGDEVRYGTPMLTADSPELGQMQAAYADARSDTQLAERNHARESELYERGITPRKALEETGAALEKARHEQERIRLQLLNLNISAGITDNRFTLRSPLSGTVTESHANPGQQIWPDSSPALFVVSDIRHLWVILDIFEKDLALIHPGQVVTLSVLAYPGEKFQAHVEYVHQVVDETTRTIKVRCTLDNPQLKLLPAMFASAEVESDPDDKAIVVPLSAIFTEGNADWLFTVTQPGHYHRKKVSVGLRLKDSAVIEQGISPGTRMVMDGAFLLHNEAMTRQPSS
ncbi:MAG: hypothetical protein RIQ52_994 [Pseudomonadota bacterium]